MALEELGRCRGRGSKEVAMMALEESGYCRGGPGRSEGAEAWWREQASSDTLP